LLPLADNRIKQALLNFKRQTEHVKDMPAQQKHCVRYLAQTLPSAIGRLFVDAQFSNADRTAARALVDGAFSAMGTMLKSVNWLETQSAGNALTKLNGYVKNIGYSDWILNDTRMDAYYSSLNLIYTDPSQRGNWYFDSLTLTTFAQVTDYSILDDPVARTNFLLSPAVTSAWYQPWYNSMTIPAGILQPPLFRADFPAAVNYGSIGFTGAHEIAHGFDDRAIQFYANGALQTWLDQQSAAGFRQMADCLVNQYGQICYPELGGRCVSGVKTQGEGIADGTGIREAFLAYQAYIAKNGAEQLLPGLEKYSMEQIFFINVAGQFCGSAKTEYLQGTLLTDNTPNKQRINAAVKNFQTFGQTFGCKQGVDPMYPKPADVCYAWGNAP